MRQRYISPIFPLSFLRWNHKKNHSVFFSNALPRPTYLALLNLPSRGWNFLDNSDSWIISLLLLVPASILDFYPHPLPSLQPSINHHSSSDAPRSPSAVQQNIAATSDMGTGNNIALVSHGPASRESGCHAERVDEAL